MKKNKLHSSECNQNTLNYAKISKANFILRLLQGALVGLGAVLPGVSGGVLCVIFGIYAPIVEVLSHPFTAGKKHFWSLIPVVIGIGCGFLGISKLLGFLLESYPVPSVCFFVGLIAGMMPSLFREAGEKGRGKGSFIALGIALILVLALLLGIKAVSLEIKPNFAWYIFCGVCMALSLIVPGMSFSTLLMPLGLYTPLVAGIGSLNFAVLIPAGIGALLTLFILAKAVEKLMNRHYSIAFHAIIGIVISATVMIIPFDGFIRGWKAGIINIAFIIGGALLAMLLDRIGQRFCDEKPAK